MGVSNQKGDVGEFFFMYECAEKGYWVAQTTQDCPYDVVLDRRQGQLERVQIKYRTVDKYGYVTFKMQDKWREEYRGYTSEQVDYVALYVPEVGKTALISTKEIEAGPQEPRFRVREAKQKRASPAKSIYDYLNW